MAAVTQIAAVDLVAVGEQERELGFVGGDAGAVTGQNVGPVQVIGDTPEPFCLALGAVGVAGLVEPFQRGVGSRIQQGHDGQYALYRQVEQSQTALALLVLGEGHPVHADAVQGEPLPIQHQRFIVLAIAPQTGDGGHLGQRLLQLKVEIDAVDPVERSPVILAIFGRHGLGVIGHYCLLPRL